MKEIVVLSGKGGTGKTSVTASFVYLGGEDKIIDVEAAREFFLHVATVTYIKNANHFLQIN